MTWLGDLTINRWARKLHQKHNRFNLLPKKKHDKLKTWVPLSKPVKSATRLDIIIYTRNFIDELLVCSVEKRFVSMAMSPVSTMKSFIVSEWNSATIVDVVVFMVNRIKCSTLGKENLQVMQAIFTLNLRPPKSPLWNPPIKFRRTMPSLNSVQ